MKIYKKIDLKMLDDIYENEFALNILTTNLPNLLKQFEEKETLSYITSKIEDGYTLFIQNPSFPRKKLITQCILFSENIFFSLYMCNKHLFNNDIVDFLEEYEYTRGFNFFLIKNINNVKLNLPRSSQGRIDVEITGENIICLVQIDSKLVIELIWSKEIIS